MAIIDVVKYQTVDGELCHKFDSDDLRMGTQLVVHPAQTAFFVKGGAICDEFTAGTYRIDTENIPILNKIINLPFGSESPFQAEVWFINQTAKLNLPWGTPHPIQIEDPRYHIIVPVRAHGQYGIRVTNPRIFLETLIGSMGAFTSEQIEQFYKGRIISALNSLLARQIVTNGISILDINTLLLSMSDSINEQLNQLLGKYGVSIIEFSIMSITSTPNARAILPTVLGLTSIPLRILSKVCGEVPVLKSVSDIQALARHNSNFLGSIRILHLPFNNRSVFVPRNIIIAPILFRVNKFLKIFLKKCSIFVPNVLYYMQGGDFHNGYENHWRTNKTAPKS